MDKITLFRGFPVTNNYVWSPFVVKFEARLRHADVAYALAVGSPRTAPRGKIPYVSLPTGMGDDSATIGDSTLIIRALMMTGDGDNKGVLPDLNARLTPAQRAQDLALRAMLEEKLYFYNGRERWVDNYAIMKEGVLAAVPWPLRGVVGWMARGAMTRTLHGQGTGRLADDEVDGFRGEIWESVEGLLGEVRTGAEEGEGPFWVLGGEGPSEADMCLFGFIVSALMCDA
ncbi:hypothetical protein N3K66_007866 [Trichothecium roseum]|uniref:Uncharacterized protein n=1 Tax=Trichothecium roseum TaxID=47278 RepID=A0ACC0UTJ1_9HYPO|nr:hypothetical protein N3K66_007866 [Trichothecium roseum]